MIAQLEGQVTWVSEDSLILNVQGVGYLVFGTAAVLRAASEQSLLRLWVETLVREDAITLYGFLEPTEQQLFRLLLNVQGVGARVAMALLSTFGVVSLEHLILTQDKKGLVRADGVGNKLAERLILELKDKITKARRCFSLTSTTLSTTSASPSNPLLREGFEALSSLGYRATESMPALERALQKGGDNPSLESLVRQALLLLSQSQSQSA